MSQNKWQHKIINVCLAHYLFAFDLYSELEIHLIHIDLDVSEHCLVAEFRTEERGLIS